MHSARLLVLKAHRNFAHAQWKQILVTIFVFGLYDNQLAASVASLDQDCSGRRAAAAEGKAVRRDKQPRRSNNNLLYIWTCVVNFDNSPDVDLELLN